MYDVIIIGAGITGSLLARDLSRYNISVALLEKDNDIANGATAANSAIIHAGHDPKDGTLKAVLNVRGNQMYEQLCKELGVDFQRCGAFVIATNDDELPHLNQLYEQAKKRNILVTYLSQDEVLAKEPNVNPHVIAALDLPSTAIVTPWEVAIAAVEDAISNGVELYLNQHVQSIKNENDHFVITTSKTIFTGRIVINCAGVYADDIYRMVSNQVLFSITPRRGEYYVLDKADKPVVGRVIYPLPSEKGKGVLVVPTIHKNVLLGPNSEVITEKDGIDNTADALSFVRKEVSKTVTNIPMHTMIRTFAGLRPTGNTKDFVIEEAADVPDFINVACIDSPGLASAPAISEYVLHQILLPKYPFALKSAPLKPRRPWLILQRMPLEQRQAMVKQDARFGQMVCRCEHISEGEIVDAIHRNAGATTVKGIKKRVRPGSGRCQGGFCEPRIVAILARELNCSPLDVLFDSEDSRLLVSQTKEEIL